MQAWEGLAARHAESLLAREQGVIAGAGSRPKKAGRRAGRRAGGGRAWHGLLWPLPTGCALYTSHFAWPNVQSSPANARPRFIGRGEIEEALRSGRINARKSQPALRPCPKYTVDAAVGPTRKNVQVGARRPCLCMAGTL